MQEFHAADSPRACHFYELQLYYGSITAGATVPPLFPQSVNYEFIKAVGHEMRIILELTEF